MKKFKQYTENQIAMITTIEIFIVVTICYFVINNIR